MDGDFYFKKQRVNKMFYGLDAHKSYTRKDTKELIGDIDLRRQVKLSKNALGYCAPLSLETNGTIFSGNKLRYEKPTSVKKFVTVFSKRVALSAKPSVCQHCECTADNDGITHMECMPCVYPMPVSVDYVSVCAETAFWSNFTYRLYRIATLISTGLSFVRFEKVFQNILTQSPSDMSAPQN